MPESDTATTDTYLSSAQAARRLGVSTRTLLRAVHRGDVTPARQTPGGALRFLPSDLGAYTRSLSSRRRGAANGQTRGAVTAGRAGSTPGAATHDPRWYERAFQDLAAVAADPGADPDVLITSILALLAERLDVGLTFLARVDGDTLHIERAHDRAGMGVREGAAVPLGDTYCQAMLAGAARSLVVEDMRSDPRFAALPPTRRFGVGSYSGVPLYRAGGQLYGTLCALHPRARTPRAGEIALLQVAGRLVAQAAETAAARREERRLAEALSTHGADLRRAAETAAAVVGERDLPRVLDRIVRAAAESACLATNSLLLLDDEGVAMRHAAAVGLPDAYIAAIDGLPIGPTVGTCGAAAWRGEIVVTEDVRADPNWAPYRALVAPYGWRAVWSVPLHGAEGRALGTFAAYQIQPGRPTAQQLELLTLYAHLAAAAVERARAGEQQARLAAKVAAGTKDLARSEARLQTIVGQLPSGVVAVDRQGHVLLVNEAGRRLAGPPDAALPAVPEKAALYSLRDAETGQPLAPADTPLGRALAGERVENHTLLHRRPGEAEDRWCRASASPLRDDATGQVTGAVVVFSDTTDERRLLRDLAASEERLRATVSNAPIVLFACNHAGVVTLSQGHGLAPLGRAADEIVGLSVFDVYCDAPMVLENLRRALAGETFTAPSEVAGFVFETRYMPQRDADGALTGVIGVATDVTERHRAEQDVRASEERFRALSEHATDLVLVINRDRTIRYASPSHARVLGFEPGELEGRGLFDFIHPDDRAAVRRGIALTMAAGDGVATVVFRGRHKDGSWRLLEAIGNNRFRDPAVRGWVVNSRDVTERAEMEAQLRRQALHDALTGLPNRTLLQDRLRQALRATRRDALPATAPSLALLLLDLDRFKEVNDTLGHHHGDLLLRQVAARLCATLRDSDTIARLGGDEFAVLLPATGEEGARAASEKIVAALALPFDLEDAPVQVGVSVGIALAPEHGQDVDALLRHADVAMYVAKKAGENCALYTSERDMYTPDRLALIADLRRAIADGGLALHYQPKADLATKRVTGVEALARWTHPRRGAVPPDQFIPLAEQTGLIAPLTRWVLAAALRQAGQWRRAGLRLDMAINLSALDLRDAGLPDALSRLLRAHAVPPSAVRLEVTESALMTDPAGAQAVLARLSALGVGLSVDDYGAGYSSLTYLKQLPVDELKIDRSFVRHMAADAADAAIVSSTIGLGHNLGLRVVAEGVEDWETWALLAGTGCDTAPGYYLARPMPADEVERWVRAASSAVA